MLAPINARGRGNARKAAREDPKKYFNAVRQIILQGQKEGGFRPVDIDVVASTIFGIFAHLPYWYRKGGRISPESLVDVLRSAPRDRALTLAIGPEGGFADEEAAQLAAAGFVAVRLAPFVLRTELAAVAALSVVAAHE